MALKEGVGVPLESLMAYVKSRCTLLEDYYE